MAKYFLANYPGPAFVLFGPSHIAALAAIALLNLYLIRFRHSGEQTKRSLRWTLAIILWLDEAAWHIWNLAAGTWTVQFMLPLNLCSIFIWLSGFMLIFRSRRIYEFAYFLGIGAAFQYLMTPDLGIYGFPHFRFFQTFISHGLLLTAAIYMTVVEGFRPTWKSLWRAVLWTNLYLVAIFFVNKGLGSDYLDINAKPGTPSILDLLPPWPYYVAYMELIGIITFLLLYLPFAIKDRRARPASP